MVSDVRSADICDADTSDQAAHHLARLTHLHDLRPNHYHVRVPERFFPVVCGLYARALSHRTRHPSRLRAACSSPCDHVEHWSLALHRAYLLAEPTKPALLPPAEGSGAKAAVRDDRERRGSRRRRCIAHLADAVEAFPRAARPALLRRAHVGRRAARGELRDAACRCVGSAATVAAAGL
jgi:hypothetical protein